MQFWKVSSPSLGSLSGSSSVPPQSSGARYPRYLSESFLSIIGSKSGLSGHPFDACTGKNTTSPKSEDPKCNVDPLSILEGKSSESKFNHKTPITGDKSDASGQAKTELRCAPINSHFDKSYSHISGIETNAKKCAVSTPDDTGLEDYQVGKAGKQHIKTEFTLYSPSPLYQSLSTPPTASNCWSDSFTSESSNNSVNMTSMYFYTRLSSRIVLLTIPDGCRDFALSTKFSHSQAAEGRLLLDIEPFVVNEHDLTLKNLSDAQDLLIGQVPSKRPQKRDCNKEPTYIPISFCSIYAF